MIVWRFAACHWSVVMWNKLWDWYLALIDIIITAGGLYIASHSGSNDGSAKEQSKQTDSGILSIDGRSQSGHL